MATTDDKIDLIHEMWSKGLLDVYKMNLTDFFRPRRDRATQALRNAALGYDEEKHEDTITITRNTGNGVANACWTQPGNRKR